MQIRHILIKDLIKFFAVALPNLVFLTSIVEMDYTYFCPLAMFNKC